jgi:hypothetical protein
MLNLDSELTLCHGLGLEIDRGRLGSRIRLIYKTFLKGEKGFLRNSGR